MPPIEPAATASVDEPVGPPPRAGASVGKYLVVAVVVASIGATVWIVLDALPSTSQLDPGRGARRSGQATEAPAVPAGEPQH